MPALGSDGTDSGVPAGEELIDFDGTVVNGGLQDRYLSRMLAIHRQADCRKLSRSTPLERRDATSVRAVKKVRFVRVAIAASVHRALELSLRLVLGFADTNA